MRYARFVNQGVSDFTISRKVINLGDPIQWFGVLNMYQAIGIPEKEIFEIPVFDMDQVDQAGELTLIMQGHITHSMLRGVMSKKNIRPLFIGFALLGTELDEEEIEYIRQYQPILCRDEITYRILSAIGIESYIFGCLSFIFPQRMVSKRLEKVFFVDTPESLKKFIPPSMESRIEYVSHAIPLISDALRNEDLKKAEITAINALHKYAQEAILVVSSRLHCLCPCLAMGIPVIAVRNNFSYRYSFIDRYIPLYTPDMFSEIEWRPSKFNLVEENKKQMLSVCENILVNGHFDMNQIQKIHNSYINRERTIYCKNIKDQLRQLASLINRKKAFVLWGIGAGGISVYLCVKEVFPELPFAAVIDRFEIGIFENKPIVSPDKAYLYDDCYFFLTTQGGRQEAERYMKELGKKEFEDYCFLHENIFNKVSKGEGM